MILISLVDWRTLLKREPPLSGPARCHRESAYKCVYDSPFPQRRQKISAVRCEALFSSKLSADDNIHMN